MTQYNGGISLLALILVHPATGCNNGSTKPGQTTKDPVEVGDTSGPTTDTVPVDTNTDTQDTSDSGGDTAEPDTTVYGIDISNWNTGFDWTLVAGDGISFVFVKATEDDYYVSSEFEAQFSDSFDAGLIRGAYHFAHPDSTDGFAQADYFVANGGDWTADGKTLPGAVMLEYNPIGDTCYDQEPDALVSWMMDFSDEYEMLTGRIPIIYTNPDWWDLCIGDAETEFSNPLWVSDFSSRPTIPGGWTSWTFWLYDTGTVTGASGSVDLDRYNGLAADLTNYALSD